MVQKNSIQHNSRRNANFIAWAKKNPELAREQAYEESAAGNGWKLELLDKHGIGKKAVIVVKSAEVTPAPKPTYALLYDDAKLAELEAAIATARSELAAARLFNKSSVSNAQKALRDARLAHKKALASNARVSAKMAA